MTLKYASLIEVGIKLCPWEEMDWGVKTDSSKNIYGS